MMTLVESRRNSGCSCSCSFSTGSTGIVTVVWERQDVWRGSLSCDEAKLDTDLAPSTDGGSLFCFGCIIVSSIYCATSVHLIWAILCTDTCLQWFITINVCTCTVHTCQLGKLFRLPSCAKESGSKARRWQKRWCQKSLKAKLWSLFSWLESLFRVLYHIGIINSHCQSIFQFFAVVIAFGHSGCCCHASWTFAQFALFFLRPDSIQILFQHR